MTPLARLGWMGFLGTLACGEAHQPPPHGAAGGGSGGTAGQTSGAGGSLAGAGTGGSLAGEGGEAGEDAGRGGSSGAGRGGAGRGGAGGSSGAGRGGTGGAGAAGKGGTAGISGSSGNAGSAGTAGAGGNPCSIDNGGCDLLTTCTPTATGRECGDCPTFYDGNGENGCVPKSCEGDPGVDCPCVKVAPDGDDAAAVESRGQTPFASIQSAVDYANAHRNVAVHVCVAAAADCSSAEPYTYSGPEGGAIVMRDGISVWGRYEPASFTRCTAPSTRANLVPAVEVPDTVQTATTLDGFRLPADGIKVRGARGVTLSNLSIVNESVAGTWLGLDVSEGAELVVSEVSILSDFFEPGIPGELMGIRSVASRVSAVSSRVTLYSGGGTTTAVVLEDSPGSALDALTVRVSLETSAPETTLTGIRILGSGNGVAVSGGTVTINGEGVDSPTHQIGIDLSDADGVTLSNIDLATRDATGTSIGVRAVRSTVELSGSVRLSPDGPEGDAVVLADAPGSLVTATLIVTGRDDEDKGFWGLRMSGDAANVAVTGSAISTTASVGRAGGIFVDGADAAGLEITESTVTASGRDGDVFGIRLEDCGGAEPTIADNPSIVARSSRGTAPVEAIRVAGDCHPVISRNASIVSFGDDGGATNHTAIHCAALSAVPSRCTIADNPDVRAESPVVSASAGSPIIRGTGIYCEAGSCAEILRNEVSGMVHGFGSCQRSCVVQSYGVHLDGTAAKVARNVIRAGCGGVARGILAENGASGRVENNYVQGRSTDQECNTPSVGVIVSSSIGILASNLDVHSNSVSAGGSRFSSTGDCTSAAVSVGGGIVRNNRLSTGDCDIRYVVMGGSGFAAFENNLLVPDLAVLFAPDLDLTAVNGLPNSSGNISSCDTPPGCIDGGTPVGAPADDFFGNPRDESPDIGPVETIAPMP